MNSPKRYSQIDVLYTIGTTLVIFGHSHSSDWSTFDGTILQKAIVFVYTFHMPLFFFIAGFLFLNSSSIIKLGYRRWIKNKAIKLLTPYFVLSIIAMIPKFYIENHTMITVRYILEAVIVPRRSVWGYFWFIPVLFLCYALFGVWRLFVTENNKRCMLIIVTVVTGLLYFSSFSTSLFGYDDFKKGSVFFCLGMIFQYTDIVIKNKNIRSLEILIFVGNVIFLYKNHYGNKMAMFLIAILMIMVCWQIANIIQYNKYATWISKHNFTIYIYSWLFQAVVMVIVGKLKAVWYLTSIFMFISGFLGPILLIFIYKKFEYIHNKLFDLILGVK